MQAHGLVSVPETWLRDSQADLGFSGPGKALVPGTGPGLAPPQAWRLLSPSLAEAIPSALLAFGRSEGAGALLAPLQLGHRPGP